MSRAAHFKVSGRLDNASARQPGTVTIDRGARVFTVRPHGRRRVYELPLDVVAEMVVTRILRAEVFAKRLARAEWRRR